MGASVEEVPRSAAEITRSRQAEYVRDCAAGLLRGGLDLLIDAVSPQPIGDCPQFLGG